ncbi:MAG: hypothetical protein CMI01_11995 [Oceanospirillaceae bacterium]|nr:hypothetical protein [Oceanospirillaceae bacterium]
MIKRNLKQAGMSLIELMIAIFVGLIVVAGALTVYVNTVSSSSSTLKMSMLNQELSTLMSVMALDLRRAGFNAGLSSGAMLDNRFQFDETAEPNKQMIFRVVETQGTATTGDDVVSVAGANDPGDCILFAYDENLDGVVDGAEFAGFKLLNGSVQMRTAVANPGDNDPATSDTGIIDNDGGAADYPDNCANGTWLTVTDTELIEITELEFNLDNSYCLNTDALGVAADCYTTAPTSGSGDITLESYVVTISLAGRLANDTLVQASLEQDVQVRNGIVRER